MTEPYDVPIVPGMPPHPPQTPPAMQPQQPYYAPVQPPAQQPWNPTRAAGNTMVVLAVLFGVFCVLPALGCGILMLLGALGSK